MTTMAQWARQHEMDARSTLPKVVEMLNARRSALHDYAVSNATSMLNEVNNSKDANSRRLRAVVVAIDDLKTKVDTDPLFTSKEARKQLELLKNEYAHLRGQLPYIAEKLDNARAITADPVAWAERRLESQPLVAANLPPLPPF